MDWIRPLRIPALLLGLCSLGAAACGGSSDSGDDVTPQPARILSFTASPDTIHEAADVTLRWELERAEGLLLLANDEPVELGDGALAEGMLEVALEETTNFELIVTGSVGEPARATATVELVILQDAPSIATFTGPEVVGLDESGSADALLSWTGVLEAASLYLDADTQERRPLELEQAPDGALELSLTEDTNFTLVAINDEGEARREHRIRVVALPTIDDLQVDRDHIGLGEEVTLSWETTGATRVELSVDGEAHAGLEPAFVDGSFSLPVLLDSILELRAYNEVGSMVSASVAITVAPPAIVSVSELPSTLWLGESITIEWDAIGASASSLRLGEEGEIICSSVDPEVANSSSCPWTPATLGSFELELRVENGSGADHLLWTVVVGDGPRVLAFIAAPLQITAGEEIELSWTVSPDHDGEAPSLSLEDDRGGVFTPTEGGALVFRPEGEAGSITYTLTASTSHPLSTPAVASASIEIFPLPAVTLAASPTHFDDSEDETVTLNWISTDAQALTLYALDGDGQVELLAIAAEEFGEGSHSLIPTEDTTYRLVAQNSLGYEVHADAEVTLAPLGVLSFEGAPTEIVTGEGVELSWRTRMAHEVTLDAFGQHYLREDTGLPYLDAQALGGSFLPLTTDCGQTAHAAGCALLPFPEGFTFPFDGLEHQSVRVFYGGSISFDYLLKSNSIAHYRFPTGDNGANYHISAFWGSLAYDETRYPQGNIHTLLREDDEAGNSLIIQWKDIGFNGNRTASLNFEIILWEDGTFEYRYGAMEPGTAPIDYVKGSRFTVGYQSFDQTHFDVINFDNAVPLYGLFENRAFRYKPVWTLPKEGSYVWHPLATGPEASATLTARRGENVDSETVHVTVHRRPELFITSRPEEALLVEDGFTIRWTAALTSKVEVLDAGGAVRCSVTNPNEIASGSCALSEDSEAVHVYTIRATGALGSVVEKDVQVVVYEPFGIVSFTADQDFLEIGETVTLSWETFNAAQISLVANEKEYLPSGAPSGPGSIEVDDLPKGSIFVLRVTNAVGVSVEESFFVDLWKVRMTVTPSTTVARPGVPFTIAIDAEDLVGGPTPVVRGTLPMVEKTGAEWAYLDISTLEEIRELSYNSALGRAAVEFPEGFSFPFFDESHQAATALVPGYLSFDSGSVPSLTSNVPLPSAGNRQVHLAPFWDAQRRYNRARGFSKQIDEDTFVIQWTSMSFNVTGVNDANQGDMNYQIWLHRDGSFEYRFGEMKPIPNDLPANRCYPHNNCLAETQGASATIGYQTPSNTTGYTFHFGGTANAAANTPLPGGLDGRTFAYAPIVGAGTIEFTPLESQDYIFCTRSGDLDVCKTIHVSAEFGIDSFQAEDPVLTFGASTKLRWESHGATELFIHDDKDQLIFSTTDTSIIDGGSLDISPAVNTSYSIEVRAASYTATASTLVEVSRMTLSLSAPAFAVPGASIPLSWSMNQLDSEMSPVVIAPMGEVSSAPFSQWDLSSDPDAQSLLGPNVATGMAVLEFDADFSFPFLGEPQSSAYVSLEGFLSFEAAASSTGTNQPIPATTLVYKRVHMAPFWDDLNAHGSGQVLAKRVGPDTYVIQWSRMSVQVGSSAANLYDLNFQVILHRDGSFEYRYGTMKEPLAESTACKPASCWSEANGSSATIGYQHPELLLGSMVHHSTTAALNNAVPGGLTNRSWRYDANPAGGTINVPAWNSSSYQLCAFDPVTHDTICSPTVEVSVPWSLSSFEATPRVVRKDAPVTLSWKSENLDLLVITANGVEIERLVGNAIPAAGSITHNPAANTTYEVVGTSLGREILLSDAIEIQTFELNVQGPQGRGFPGSLATLSWSSTQYEPGEFHVLPPLVEIPAGIGEPGHYQDIRENPDVVQLTPSNTTTGAANVDIHFPFPFFGESYGKARVYVKGYLSFDMAAGSGNSSNSTLPSTTSSTFPINLAPFWDDLVIRGESKLHALELDADTFIIQWTNFNRSAGSNATNADTHYDLNFQVVLRSNGDFEYRYGTMTPPKTPANQTSCWPASCALEAEGGSATIAYQVPGVRLAYNHHVGGNDAQSIVPIEGGLAGRTFGYSPLFNGSTQVLVGSSKEYRICGFTETYQACQSVWIDPVAEPGDLMITELMVDPTAGASGQWFELRNLSDDPIDLEGFTIQNDRGSHAVASSVSIPSRGFVTLAASATALPNPSYVYGPLIELDRPKDRLAIRAGTSTIASAEWDSSWTVTRGKSLGVDPSYHLRGAASVDDHSMWCDEGDGTPGALGAGCRSSFYSVDPASDLPFYDISLTGTHMPEFEVNNAIAEIPVVGFSMPYFNTAVNKVWASGNGWISFAQVQPTLGTSSPTSLPRTQAANPQGPLLAAFFTDLRCAPATHTCGFYYQQTTIDERDVLILQWSGFRPGGGAGELHFQAQLWESGDVVVAFADALSSESPTTSGFRNYRGEQAWIGVEGPDTQDLLTAHHRTILDMAYRTFHFRRK